MLQSLITRVQGSIRSTLGEVALLALIALPFLIAIGFAIAAVAEWVYRHYGTLLGNFAIAGGFAVLGLLLLGIHSIRSAPTDSADPQPDAVEESLPVDSNPLSKFFADVDAGLLLSLAGTLLPLFMPRREAVLRALPILAVVGLIVLIAMRSSSGMAGATPGSGAAQPESGAPEQTPAGA